MFIQTFRLQKIFFAVIIFLLILAIALNILSIVFAIWRTSAPVEAKTKSPEKVVYLTFDDGPSVVTIDILDYLKEAHIPATFFVTGATTDRGKMLYHRIVDEGHSLGLHSYSHRYKQIYANADAYLADLIRLEKHLNGIVGEIPKIFRFPGGSTNRGVNANTLREIIQKTTDMGYVYFDWNAVAHDDHAMPTPAKEMFQNIVKSAGNQKNIQILMHDDALRTTAVDCLRLLVSYYTEQGYCFQAITKETVPIQFSILKSVK